MRLLCNLPSLFCCSSCFFVFVFVALSFKSSLRQRFTMRPNGCRESCSGVHWSISARLKLADGEQRPVLEPFRLCKFLPQTKLFCSGSAFLLHDNGMQSPLKLQTFDNWVPECILLKLQPSLNWQTAKLVTAVTTPMLMHSAVATTKL